jgi:protein TonB
MLVYERHEATAGGGGQQLDAISVTLVSSSVLEARETEQLRTSAPVAAGRVEATDGAADSAPATAVEREEKEEKHDAEMLEKLAEEPVRAVEAVTEASAAARRRRTSDAAAAVGGAAARSEHANNAVPSAAVATASAGAVREYARYVAQALARSKPKGTGGRGTVRLKFIIAADGALGSAEIARSSGNRRLDETALAALRRVRFPLPPRGMSTAQLTYEVPYHFR